jgi:hypothetical protein
VDYSKLPFAMVFKSISCGSELDVDVLGKSDKNIVWYKVTVDCFDTIFQQYISYIVAVNFSGGGNH